MKRVKGLTDKIKGLDGKPLLDADERPLLVKEVIANAVARGNSEDAMRAMDVATKFYRAQTSVIVDDADVVLALKCLKDDRFYTNMAKSLATLVLANADDVEQNRAQRRAKSEKKPKPKTG